MTQTLTLTAAELALIENARKQEILNQEAKALQFAAKLEKDIIETEKAILKEQAENNAQVMATLTFHAQLEKINPKYRMIQEDKEAIRQIKGEYLPDSKYEREIFKEIKYNSTSAHIILDGTPFKIEVKKHLVYGSGYSTRYATDKGYKMNLIGGGFYNERLLSSPKTLNKKIEDKLQDNINAVEAKIKKASAVEFVFDNLSIQYPNALITKGTEWQRNTYSKQGGEMIDIIGIKLANGIYIKYRVYPDKSIGRLEMTFPVKDSYQLLELMNGLNILNND